MTTNKLLIFQDKLLYFGFCHICIDPKYSFFVQTTELTISHRPKILRAQLMCSSRVPTVEVVSVTFSLHFTKLHFLLSVTTLCLSGLQYKKLLTYFTVLFISPTLLTLFTLLIFKHALCRGYGLAIEPTSENPEGPGSSSRIGSRRSSLISIKHTELLSSTPLLVLCCA